MHIWDRILGTEKNKDINKFEIIIPPEESNPNYTKHVLTESQSDTPVGEWNTELLHEIIEKQWGEDFEEAGIVAEGEKYTAWLEYFREHNFGYGTVSAWAGAVVRNPSIFLAPGSNPKWRLDPSQFDEYCELAAGSTFIHEPEIDRNGNIILQDDINPARRVWDVRANRVIHACWVPHATIEPVSHAWVTPDQLEYIWSPVNYFQWGIPVPNGCNLDLVRQELLKYEVEYSWLDVLCLRQRILPELSIPISEDLIAKFEVHRVREWATDVPLIGGIYMFGTGRVIVYLNGLGKDYDPSDPEIQNLNNQRHWLRRAWTLQETVVPGRFVVAGLAEGILHPLLPQGLEESSALIAGLLDCTAHKFGNDILKDVAQMAPRYATNPMDKVAGLFFVLFGHLLRRENRGSVRIPKYDETKSQQEAWGHLIHSGLSAQGLDGYSGNNSVTQLLGSFPYSSSEHWFPGWDQVMAWPTLLTLDGPQDALYTVPPKYDLSIQVLSGRLYKDFNITTVNKHSGPVYHLTGNQRRMHFLGLKMDRVPIKLQPVQDASVEEILRLHEGSELRILVIGLEKVEGVVPMLNTDGTIHEQGNIYHNDKARFLVCRDITSLRANQGPYQRTYLKVIACLQVPRPKHLRPDDIAEFPLYGEEFRARLEGIHVSPQDRVYLE